MSFPFEARAQEESRPVQQHANVIEGHIEDHADIGGGTLFHLPEMKDIPVQIRECARAGAHRLGHLSRLHESVGPDRRLRPRAIGIEARLEHLFDRLRPLVSLP